MEVENDRETLLNGVLWRASGHLLSFRGEDKEQPQGQSVSQICLLFLVSSSKLLFYQILSEEWASISSCVNLILQTLFFPLCFSAGGAKVRERWVA